MLRHIMTNREMFEKAFERPLDFFTLSGEQQWEIDKRLGILDWVGTDLTKKDKERFNKHFQLDKSGKVVHKTFNTIKHMSSPSKEEIALMRDYPYIVAWGSKMGSHGYYIVNECREAKKDKVPKDVVFKTGGKWRLFSELGRFVQKELEAYRDGTKGAIIINY